MTMKAFKCTVDLAIHRVTAPGVRFSNKEELYLNVCLLGQQRRTRLVPSQFPLIFDDHLVFEKTFRFCRDPSDVVTLLNGLHTYVELVQLGKEPGTEILANFETTAKEFLYPFPNSKFAYHIAERNLFMTRTIEFPGTISPQFEFCTTTRIEESHTPAINLVKEYEERFQFDPLIDFKHHESCNSKRSKRKVKSANTFRKHTISSAIKSDIGKPDVRRKLRELNSSLNLKVQKVPNVEESKKPLFVMKHYGEELIGRKPGSHEVLNDGLVVRHRSRSASRTKSTSRAGSRSKSQSKSRSPSHKREHRSLSPRWRHPFVHSALYGPSPFYTGNQSKCDVCANTHEDCEVCENYRYRTGNDFRGHRYHHDETKLNATQNSGAVFDENDAFRKKTATELLKENRHLNTSDYLRRPYSPVLSRNDFLGRYGDLDEYYAERNRIRDLLDRSRGIHYPLNHSFSHYSPPLMSKYYSINDSYNPWYHKYYDYLHDIDDELFWLKMRSRYPDLY